MLTTWMMKYFFGRRLWIGVQSHRWESGYSITRCVCGSWMRWNCRAWKLTMSDGRCHLSGRRYTACFSGRSWGSKILIVFNLSSLCNGGNGYILTYRESHMKRAWEVRRGRGVKVVGSGKRRAATRGEYWWGAWITISNTNCKENHRHVVVNLLW